MLAPIRHRGTQPCPCGFFNHPDKECVCSGESVQRYLNKISGPLLDRIDLHVEVNPVALKLLSEKNNISEKSDVVRERVESARTLQRQRFVDDDHIFSNAQMSSKMIREHCKIKTEGASILNTAMEKLGLSARAYDRILKVARTIADLENSETIETAHLAEAIQFRTLDRSGWGL